MRPVRAPNDSFHERCSSKAIRPHGCGSDLAQLIDRIVIRVSESSTHTRNSNSSAVLRQYSFDYESEETDEVRTRHHRLWLGWDPFLVAQARQIQTQMLT